MTPNPLQLLLTILLVLSHNSAFGQPSYSLNTYSVRAPVFDAQGSPLYGTDYLAELWGGSTSNSLSPAITYYSRQRFMVPFTFAPGHAVGSTTPDELTVSEWVGGPWPGNWAWLELRAWDARLGDTYEEVEALSIGGYGKSQPFFAPAPSAGLLLPNAPWSLNGLQSFSLLPVVPEPSTFALLGLGTVMFFIARHSGNKLNDSIAKGLK